MMTVAARIREAHVKALVLERQAKHATTIATEARRRAEELATALILTKHCPGCDTTKPRDEFYRETRRHDGLCGYCKQCKRARNRPLARKHNQKTRAKNCA